MLRIRNENIAFLALRELQDDFHEVQDSLNYSDFIFDYDFLGYSLKLLFNDFDLRFDRLFQDTSKSDSKIIERGEVHPSALVLRINGHFLRFADNIEHLAYEIDQLIYFDKTVFFSLDHFLVR